MTVWKLIPELNQHPSVTTRENPVICQLSETQIIILGGTTTKKWTNDVILFDAETEQVQKVAAEAGRQQQIIKFHSGYNNSGVKVKGGSIVALVRGDDEKSHLIEYATTAKTISIIETFV